MARFMKTVFLTLVLITMSAPGTQSQRDQMPVSPRELIRTGQDQTKAIKVNDGIYLAVGFSNTFMVITGEGNVVIDTSMPFNASRHKRLLQAENSGAIKYIILTHGHGDHTGGIPTWKQESTRIIAQRNHVEFLHYQARLNGFYARRNSAQFSIPIPEPRAWAGNYGANIAPTILFDDRYEFELGDLEFEVYHTPGETYDHLTVWIPRYKAVFVGDNFYTSFPNIYTLRGTQPRWALDYVNSINKVLDLKPEILLPSHGMPVHGNAEISRQLTRYRDAIQYVHDETVKGMNAGKDVFALMGEVNLPPHLDIGESYGKLSWSIRGIYEGYVGWFDSNPAAMYETPARAVYPHVVKLAGGASAVAKLAMEQVHSGKPVEALHLADMALAAEPSHSESLQARLKALEALRNRCRNSNERGWLDYAISNVEEQLRKR